MSKNNDDEINMDLGKEYENIISDIEKKYPNPVNVFYRISDSLFP